MNGATGGCEGDIVPLTFGTRGYRGYNENDLPVLLQNLFTYWQTTYFEYKKRF